YGAIKEAAELLQKDRVSANIIHFSELWPFPAEAVYPLLKESKKTFVVENNYTGQLAHLIRAETGFKVDRVISRYDGRPFSPQSIVNELKSEVA
ncbi:MAG: 2-oxoacid:acceptor oxidoreductase subunit alpha, partial [Dehalococcoidia bacterium]|nr:2-oxoacid:acceptor oxidoreductase subunit alpha [Dehalococcoidia bacterium]